MRASPSHQIGGPSGSAMVITLLVITVLSIIVTSFLTSMAMERLTSQSYVNVLRADLAAQAGFSDAVHRLISADAEYPVSAYEALPIGYRGQILSAPFLTLVKPNTTWDAVAERRRYLASIRDPSSPPPSAEDWDTVDINMDLSSHHGGWIGLRDAEGARRTIPVEWIYLHDASGVVTGRYAFWVDDESSRINMQTAGSVASSGGNHPHDRLDGSTPQEISIHSLFVTPETVGKFLSFRGSILEPWRGMLAYRQVPPDVSWSASTDDLRANLAWGAIADERGALGVRKLELNAWAAKAATFTSPAGRDAIAQKVVALGDFINEADPTFANRFFDDASDDSHEADRRQYCIKLAANIQDYIDPDSQPTVIRHDLGGWLAPPDPAAIGEGAPDAPPAAFGKEVVPAIGEYVGHYYPENGALRIDHTFEVWNLHAAPMNLASLGQVRILVAERNDVTPGTGSTAPDPDLPGEPGNPPLVLPVPATSIPAGKYALLSTVPSGHPEYGKWVVGTPERIALSRNEPAYAYGSSGLRMEGDQLATAADVDTEVLLANEHGYLDIQARVAQQGVSTFSAGGGARTIASQFFGNDPSSSGNNTDRGYPLDSGDPRSGTEVFPTYSEGGGAPSSIAWRRNTANAQNATRLGGDSNGGSFGILPANTGDSGGYVPEPVPTPDMNSAMDAVSVIRNGPMRTIGELGYIYDPAFNGKGFHNPSVRKRGGFRTLAIGSTTGEKAGPALLAHVTGASRASRLLELFCTNEFRQGILLNSVLRDPSNRPWRALLAELKTQMNNAPDAIFPAQRDPHFAAGASVDADKLIEALTTHGTPFLNIGQLADLDIFNKGTDLFGGNFELKQDAANKELTDRGREEIFRHLAGLVTLKGSVFRVYAVGQAGVMRDGRFTVTGTSRLMRIYEIRRQYAQRDPLAEISMPELLTNNRATSVRAIQLAEIRE
jgi:hypothetical protein